ncbi:bifunctional DNA primase/polymerase [Hoeflea sp. G2-23]|uniref:Bifunctional DNA primase/polymerase n=1 Tax=Hoeflea algicola TaxID=2983763 RepID=A0ABT3ZGF8_9HYPH|nr:bifunctional DNA primase/polymerase [Hoeflea algicola]MCY0150900.1 bifunctional DNA primase/polymerase [Hoeflea algicola]
MSDTTVSNRETALALAAAGFSIFPCHSGGEKAKAPKPFIKWREASTTNERQIAQWWQKWPDAAIGLDLAKSGLIVVDADRHDPDKDGVEAFGQLMGDHGFDPDSAPLVATPSAGNHHYFRQRAGETLGNSEGLLKDKGINIRGHGGYVVAPGTVMADGRVYELWGDLDNVPVIPDWLHKLITTPLEPVREKINTGSHDRAEIDEIAELLGYISPDSGYQDWLAALMAVHAATGGSSTGLAVADDWSARGSKYKGTKELSAKWKSFKGQGVNLATLAALARENGADLSAIAIKHRGHEHDYDPVEAAEAARRLIENIDGTLADAETGEIVSPYATGDQVTAIDYPPGLVGDIAKWIVDTARRPQPELAIGAALAIVGTVAGRQFAGPTMSGTHLYILGLAPTGKGKDHPLQSIGRIMAAANLSVHLGPSEFISMPAVVNFLVRKPLSICAMDEFGGFMKRINSKRASGFEGAISKVIRTMWSSSFAPYMTPEWAQKASETIHAPSITLYGASTPEQFYSSMEGASLEDGTLNRFLLVNGRSTAREKEPKGKASVVPDHIREALRRIYFASGEMATTWRNDPYVDPAAQGAVKALEWSADGAHDRYMAFSAEIEALIDKDPESGAFYARTVEMALRIATIVAIGRMEGIKLQSSDLEYGIMVARQSAEFMAAGAAEWMADNENQANAQKIMRCIKARGGTASNRDLVRSLQNAIKPRDLKDILQSMCDGGQLERQEITNPKGRSTIRYQVGK